LNKKSKAMAAGSCDTAIKMMDIPYCPEITILGFRFTSTVARSGNVIWSSVTGKVRALVSDVYGREPCLTTRPVCAYLFTLQDTAYSTDFPGLEGARATSLNGNILVYRAWCDPQGTSVNPTTTEGGRRFELDRCRSQMSCPLSCQILGQGANLGIPTHFCCRMDYTEPQRQAETQRACVRHLANYVYCGEQTTGGAHHAASASNLMGNSVGQPPQSTIV
jgi:hypothetical protein